MASTSTSHINNDDSDDCEAVFDFSIINRELAEVSRSNSYDITNMDMPAFTGPPLQAMDAERIRTTSTRKTDTIHAGELVRGARSRKQPSQYFVVARLESIEPQEFYLVQKRNDGQLSMLTVTPRALDKKLQTDMNSPREKFIENEVFVVNWVQQIASLGCVPRVIEIFNTSRGMINNSHHCMITQQMAVSLESVLMRQWIQTFHKSERGLLPVNVIILARKVLEATAALHAAGVTHRDIGPHSVKLVFKPEETAVVFNHVIANFGALPSYIDGAVKNAERQKNMLRRNTRIRSMEECIRFVPPSSSASPPPAKWQEQLSEETVHSFSVACTLDAWCPPLPHDLTREVWPNCEIILSGFSRATCKGVSLPINDLDEENYCVPRAPIEEIMGFTSHTRNEKYDSWAVGLLIFELAMGDLPFHRMETLQNTNEFTEEGDKDHLLKLFQNFGIPQRLFETRKSKYHSFVRAQMVGIKSATQSEVVEDPHLQQELEVRNVIGRTLFDLNKKRQGHLRWSENELSFLYKLLTNLLVVDPQGRKTPAELLQIWDHL